ncbi:hypothetical protein ACFP63_16570 [Oerskovia jenensis]|uniref:Uncharacterized protein n=1 Tax=Oerskovia jenensis TaxID=162169 RepID=A0ABS2LF25_9CELL|nr:hypothetical protein [Oerskovia jenensis]MBM7478743.1 hypothetical protein [Oerskovia jenensis]
MTATQIVAFLKDHMGIEVTTEALIMWRKRRGLDRNPVSPKRIPWKLRPEHVNTVEAQAIRAYYGREDGLAVDKERTRILASMERRLYPRGLVIHYDPDTERGWWAVPARPGVDLGLVREPDGLPRPPRHDSRAMHG